MLARNYFNKIVLIISHYSISSVSEAHMIKLQAPVVELYETEQ